MQVNTTSSESGSLDSAASFYATAPDHHVVGGIEITQHVITYKPFTPGFGDTPTILYSGGIEPFVKKIAKPSGQEIFVAKLKLVNVRDDYVSYMVRCSDEHKILVLPSPIGVMAPEGEVVVHLCTNPNAPLSTEEYGRLRIQVLACTINVDRASYPMGDLDFWKSLAHLWGTQRLGLTFPRMEVQVFRTNGGIGGGTGDTEFLNASMNCLIAKVDRMTAAHRRLKELRRMVSALTGAGIVAIGGCVLHMMF